MVDKVEDLAMGLAEEFFTKNGWHVVNVSHAHGAHGGYDLFLQKDSETLKVEVKGSAKQYHGIPDLYDTQVDQSRKLTADYLCVGYFPPHGPEKLAIIRGSDIPPDALGGIHI